MPSSTYNAIHSSHAAYKVELTLLLESGKQVPVVDATIEFVLNQIPIARVVIPSGATFNNKNASPNAVGGNQILEPSDLRGKKKAQLQFKGTGKPHPDKSKATPSGDFEGIIFEGYVLSYVADFSTTGVATTVVLTHWLYDLDSSSFSSGDFDKTAPDAWFSTDVIGKTEDPAFLVARRGGGQGDAVGDQEYLDSDWWENIIKPAAIYKASLPLTHFQNSTAPSNTGAAITAINKVFSKDTLRLNDIAKTALRGSASTILRSINGTIGRVILTGEGGASAFDKVLYLLSMFGCVLAPKVKNCLVHTYNPLAPVDIEIPDSECDFGGSSANPGIFPVGAIMYGGGASLSKVAANQGVVETTFVGSFSPTGLQNNIDAGPFMVFPTPAYLNTLTSTEIPAGQFTSKVGIVPLSAAKTGTSSGKQILIPRDFADQVAQSYYYASVFANKTQDVICGFRLDVSPGDCVKIMQGANSVSGSNVSGLAKQWSKRGIVESVTHILSSSGKRVNTVLRLRHVLESQDSSLFGVNDTGLSSALFQNKPKGGNLLN